MLMNNDTQEPYTYTVDTMWQQQLKAKDYKEHKGMQTEEPIPHFILFLVIHKIILG